MLVSDHRPAVAARFVRAAAVLVALSLLACGSRSDSESATASAMERRLIAPVEWETIFSIGGELEDTLLLRPLLFAAGYGRFFVFDFGDRRVKAFDEHGGTSWQAGGLGRGPLEFMNPFDMKVGPDSTLWIVDRGAGRIVILSVSGEFITSVNFPGRLLTRIMPSGELVRATVLDDDLFWIAFDTTQRLHASGSFPTAAFDGVDARVRGAMTAVDGDRWSAVFPFGPPLLVYRGDELVCSAGLVESGPFPEPRGDPPPAWVGFIEFDGGVVYVLPVGMTDYRQRVVDEYDGSTCRYIRSVMLPPLPEDARYRGLAVSNQTMLLYHESPAPTLTAVRYRDR